MDTRRFGPAPGDETRPSDLPPPDEAIFAIERMPRGRDLRTAGFIVLAIACLAVVGSLGGARRAPVIAELLAPTATTAATAATPGPILDWGAPKRGDDRYVRVGAAPPLLVVAAKADARSVFVQGDVYTIGADVVVVALQDTGYRTIDVRRVRMPGGSTAMRTGANDRFSLLFRVEGPFNPRSAWITAVALDEVGGLVATASVQLQ